MKGIKQQNKKWRFSSQTNREECNAHERDNRTLHISFAERTKNDESMNKKIMQNYLNAKLALLTKNERTID